jgi:hypothetical protein
MAVHAQIDIRKGKQIVRIHHGWGVPRQVIATLRKVTGMGCIGVRSVANKYMKHVPDASFGLQLIPHDLDADMLSYRYVLDISTTPWTLKATKCAGYRIVDNGDGTFSIGTLTKVRTRTVKVMAAAAGK